MSALRIETISEDDFRYALVSYPYTVSPSLKDLDALRYDIIPAQIASTPGGGRLNVSSLESLVEWKMCVSPLFSPRSISNSRSKHGTFRPNLLALASSNTDNAVNESTEAAYRIVKNEYLTHDEEATSSDFKELAVLAMKKLTTLRGVGPATASLVLSVQEPDWCPFFSDELYRWSAWGEEESKGKGQGWKRKIGYTLKEYKELFEKVFEVRTRLEVTAVEVEKVAWVLGNMEVDLDNDDCMLEMIQDLKYKDKELKDRDQELEEDDKQVLGMYDRIGAMYGELEAKDEELEAKDKELEAKNKELKAKDKELKQELRKRLKRELKQELKKELGQETKKAANKGEAESETQEKKPKVTKRKVEDASLPTPGTRRSTRNRK